MPLYEYQCEACGHRFEIIQKFSDAPLRECPKCAGPVEKLLSSPAIQFKGSGWYITDYARAGKSDGGAGGAKKDGAAPAASGTGADAKPAESKSADAASTTSTTDSTTKAAAKA